MGRKKKHDVNHAGNGCLSCSIGESTFWESSNTLHGTQSKAHLQRSEAKHLLTLVYMEVGCHFFPSCRHWPLTCPQIFNSQAQTRPSSIASQVVVLRIPLEHFGTKSMSNQGNHCPKHFCLSPKFQICVCRKFRYARISWLVDHHFSSEGAILM